MVITKIYQTLENRQNLPEVEKHGPYFCYERNADGTLKTGIKEPWLGEGYYFWDTRMEDAQWWGETVYGGRGYIVCQTTYDQHSPLLYDLVGIVKQFDEFIQCAEYIKEKNKIETVKFAVVLSYLRKLVDFNYKAIRVWPNPRGYDNTGINFPDKKIMLGRPNKIQICFFDKTLLMENFIVVDTKICDENQTI